jgi:hypothetical protein
MKLTIIFSHSKSYNPILYWFRKTFLAHNATHVAFGIEVDNKPHVFHMSGKGAIRTPRQRFDDKNIIIKEFEIVPDLSEDLEAHLNYLGHPYNTTSAVLHFIMLLLQPIRQLLIFYKIRNMFYCANFARQLDRNDKLKSWRKIDKQWASVDELQAACENSSEFIEIKRI